ncbi:MAG TPA: hypothetical protein VLL49_11295 [Anaerolineales bacterium]|nr:hypothetical protein [Anaerolineales bacterium]
MQRGRLSALIVLMVVILTTMFVLANSVSGLERSAGAISPSTGHFQNPTSEPTEADASVAGSTDGIVWMGIVITLIVVVPLLANRALWSRSA